MSSFFFSFFERERSSRGEEWYARNENVVTDTAAPEITVATFFVRGRGVHYRNEFVTRHETYLNAKFAIEGEFLGTFTEPPRRTDSPPALSSTRASPIVTERKEYIYIYLEKPQRFFAYLSGDFRRAAPTMGNSRFDSRRLPRHSVLKVNKKVSPGVLFLFSFFFKSVRTIAKRASRVGRRCFN